MQQVFKDSQATRREISLFIFCLVVMSILYSTPKLFSRGISPDFLKELAVDCLIMALACLPVWWLQFRRWAHWPMQRRFALHLVTALFYYALWVGLYGIYNRWAGLPPMTSAQIFQNIGPNLLFYIQVFSSLHIDLFFREREAQHQREQELKELAHRAEINALKAQIQPHFLFNTLNSISASVPAEHEHTRVLIGRLADTFRYALRATQQDLVPLSQELDFVRTCLLLEQERFGKRLAFKIGTSSPDTLIPPMLLQPLVENAIKHGIEPAVDGGEISVTCVRQERKTHIRIENTGHPYAGKAQDMFNGEGVGLSNTARRLESQYGERLQVSVKPHGGVAVSFCVPAMPFVAR